ncbi:MAG: SH3 domain-containing protein [Geitlerinemataceae cyanobacterium]|mgnify:FL=1
MLSFSIRRSLSLGSLLLVLASCASVEPPDTEAPDPQASAPADVAIPEATVPPGEVDRGDGSNSNASPSADLDVAPNSSAPAPNTATNRATADGASNADSDGVRVLSCQIGGGLVNDPDGPLNIRSSPDATANNVVGTVADGAPVSIVGAQDNWWQIDAPTAGWVSKNLVDSACNEKIARIELPEGRDNVTFGDRFIGTGYHHYEFDARAGQRLALEATGESPLPFVLAPDEREITDGAANGGARLWSGELPEDGQYTLVFDSNFRGYTYEVTLEIR